MADGVFFIETAVALQKRRATAPSSGGNVYFANGQTDRTLVPYRLQRPDTTGSGLSSASLWDGLQDAQVGKSHFML
jgi:hypothetical protein